VRIDRATGPSNRTLVADGLCGEGRPSAAAACPDCTGGAWAAPPAAPPATEPACERDLRGHCCRGFLNACGECDGRADAVMDGLGRCCMSGVLDAGLGCCASGVLDACGVCDGVGASCAQQLRFSFSATAGELAAMLAPGGGSSLEAHLMLGRLAGLVNVSASRLALRSVARRTSARLRRLADSPTDPASAPGVAAVQVGPDAADADWAAALQRRATSAGSGSGSSGGGSVSLGERTGVCGNGLCELGEAYAPQLSPSSATWCAEDCPLSLSCPVDAQSGAMCSGHGACLGSSAQCVCREAQGWAGAECSACAGGWVAQGGTCVPLTPVPTSAPSHGPTPAGSDAGTGAPTATAAPSQWGTQSAPPSALPSAAPTRIASAAPTVAPTSAEPATGFDWLLFGVLLVVLLVLALLVWLLLWRRCCRRSAFAPRERCGGCRAGGRGWCCRRSSQASKVYFNGPAPPDAAKQPHKQGPGPGPGGHGYLELHQAEQPSAAPKPYLVLPELPPRPLHGGSARAIVYAEREDGGAGGRFLGSPNVHHEGWLKMRIVPDMRSQAIVLAGDAGDGFAVWDRLFFVLYKDRRHLTYYMGMTPTSKFNVYTGELGSIALRSLRAVRMSDRLRFQDRVFEIALRAPSSRTGGTGKGPLSTHLFMCETARECQRWVEVLSVYVARTSSMTSALDLDTRLFSRRGIAGTPAGATRRGSGGASQLLLKDVDSVDSGDSSSYTSDAPDLFVRRASSSRPLPAEPPMLPPNDDAWSFASR
jgi:hypothetical protein